MWMCGMVERAGKCTKKEPEKGSFLLRRRAGAGPSSNQTGKSRDCCKKTPLKSNAASDWMPAEGDGHDGRVRIAQSKRMAAGQKRCALDKRKAGLGPPTRQNKNRHGSKAYPRGTEQARYTRLGRMRPRRHGKIKTGMGARPIPGAQNRLGTQGQAGCGPADTAK